MTEISYRTSGIYKITCVATGKFYIGSSSNIGRRWNRHRSVLRSNAHPNSHLQNTWNKYGENEFVFEILDPCSADQLLAREQCWLDSTKCYDPKVGLNLSSRATGGGRPMSDEMKQKFLDANNKAWVLVSPSGEEQLVVNLQQFCRDNNLSASAMRSVSTGLRKHHKGWKCRPPSVTWDELEVKNRQLSDSKTVIANRGKRYVVVSPSGKSVEIKGLSQFCNEHGLTRSAMANVANGVRNHHKGWRCVRV